MTVTENDREFDSLEGQRTENEGANWSYRLACDEVVRLPSLTVQNEEVLPRRLDENQPWASLAKPDDEEMRHESQFSSDQEDSANATPSSELKLKMSAVTLLNLALAKTSDVNEMKTLKPTTEKGESINERSSVEAGRI